MNAYGEATIVNVDDVGEDRILVHDETRADPSLAFALSRLADQPTTPTPVGVFRAVDRPSYGDEMQRQLVEASAKGTAELQDLLRSAPTWSVG
jgi:2-oxoglutarate ferredoxin oxidoreductase subunit beta